MGRCRNKTGNTYATRSYNQCSNISAYVLVAPLLTSLTLFIIIYHVFFSVNIVRSCCSGKESLRIDLISQHHDFAYSGFCPGCEVAIGHVDCWYIFEGGKNAARLQAVLSNRPIEKGVNTCDAGKNLFKRCASQSRKRQ